MNEDIKEAGIGEGISEVIVTTKSTHGEPNAAPIGIINARGEYFIRLYEGSKTISNIKETGKLAANVTDDAIIFVQSALGRLNNSYFSLFLGFPVLKDANSWILFKSNFVKGSNLKIFKIEPFAVKINKRGVRAINRGLNAVIEATILATRYVIAENEKKKEKIRRLIEYYNGIVSKCGGEREKEAMRLLYKKCSLL
ncbi:MAG: DUF447 domain-containing protein [Candidatus Methanospirareceae archaeon]